MEILLVDDELAILKEIAECLGLLGHLVKTAESGVGGLALFQVVHPDLVISDCEMPEMDGREMCEKIREVAPNIPLIIMSGNPGNLENCRKKMESDAKLRCIDKPFCLLSLLNLIKELTTN